MKNHNSEMVMLCCLLLAACASDPQAAAAVDKADGQKVTSDATVVGSDGGQDSVAAPPPDATNGATDAAPSDVLFGDTGTDEADATTPDASSPDAGGAGTIPGSQAVAGLQYHGGVAFMRKPPDGSPGPLQFVEISAPILPSTKILYKYEGNAMPKTQAALAKAAHEASLIFDYLLTQCKADYPGITLLSPGASKPLTPAELDANFNLTAACSYAKWVAKPYWIPAWIDKVDICANELGPDWQILAEEDVHGLTADEAKLIKEALSPSKPGATGASYFSLDVYIRAANGLIMLSHLYPAAPLTTVEKAAATWLSDELKWTNHLEGSWVLRCLRTRSVVAGK